LAALDGEVATAEREALQAHLSGCQDCRAAAGETTRLHHALDALPRTAAVPAGLEQATLRRVRAVLAEEADAGARFGARWSWWWMATPMAATLVALVVWRSLPDGNTLRPDEVATLQPEPAAQRVAKAAAPAIRSTEPPAGAAAPPPQVAKALDLYLDMPILENMEKLQNFDAIRTVDVGEDGRVEGGRG
jgi:hypothetical protein